MKWMASRNFTGWTGISSLGLPNVWFADCSPDVEKLAVLCFSSAWVTRDKNARLITPSMKQSKGAEAAAPIIHHKSPHCPRIPSAAQISSARVDDPNSFLNNPCPDYHNTEPLGAHFLLTWHREIHSGRYSWWQDGKAIALICFSKRYEEA